MDIAGLPPYAGGFALRPVINAQRPAVPAVEPASAGRGVGQNPSDKGSAGDAVPNQRQDETPAPAPRRAPDDDVLTGPPPAFEASLLELESDLRRVIAQLEAARGQRESDTAQGKPVERPALQATAQAAPDAAPAEAPEAARNEPPEAPAADAPTAPPAEAPLSAETVRPETSETGETAAMPDAAVPSGAPEGTAA